MMHNIISDKDKVVSCQLAMGLWSSGAISLVARSTCLNCSSTKRKENKQEICTIHTHNIGLQFGRHLRRHSKCLR